MSKAVCFVVLCSAWILFNTISTAKSEKAQWLLRYHKKNNSFELNEDALANLSLLKLPIKVISAIGDARIGKSTALNFVRHTLENDENGKKDVEEVFKTGDEHEPVTRGIWMSTFRENNGESIIPLDVEGVDLGDDAVTNHMSMFTALLSSGFGVFCSETVTNHILDFLYSLPRVSEQVFKGIDESKSFGHLHVVIREALKLPQGVSLENLVKGKLFASSEEDGSDDKRKVLIAKYFPPYETTVSAMPLIMERGLLKQNPEYWNAIKKLSRYFKEFPAKKTMGGALVDGKVLAQIAHTLVDTMTNNSWMDIGNTYIIVEKLACSRSYHAHIAPVLQMKSSREIDDRSAIESYSRECAVDDEIKHAKKELRRRIEELRNLEEKDREYMKAQERLREEEKRRKEAERINREERCQSDDSGWGWKTIVATAVSTATVVIYALSDARLKDNITTLTPSKYELLGLREVAWVWNEDAQRLGLSGAARGVIAQEVEQLYPWAVLTGHDGYKRVNYAALDLMVALVRNKHISRIVNMRNSSSPLGARRELLVKKET